MTDYSFTLHGTCYYCWYDITFSSDDVSKDGTVYCQYCGARPFVRGLK
jgi:DNA-directed RNA polymerase subunit RPC12/RpoP